MGNTATFRLGFSDQELLERRTYLGGSDSNILMSGDGEAIYDLFQRKTGRAPEPDLSDNLAVHLGIWSEPANCAWYERITGRAVTARNAFRRSEKYHWMAANLDGITTAPSDLTPAYWEAKFMGAYTNLEGAVQRYMAQLTHCCLVLGTDRAVLSIITGRPSYELFEMELDEFYAAELIEREKAFWECVERDTPPPGFRPIVAPIPPEKFRTVSFEGNNLFADAAARWLGSRTAAQTFKGAEKDLKGMVEPDVGKAFGYGVAISRNKAGALSIREG